jgi:hypothetical protein
LSASVTGRQAARGVQRGWAPRGCAGTTPHFGCHALPPRGNSRRGAESRKGSNQYCWLSYCLPAVSCPSNSRGAPISTTTMRPTYSRAASESIPTLGATKVTVRLARTAMPPAWPVSQSSPLGISTAITGILSAPARLICSMSSRSGERTVPAKPVPSKASTMHSLPARSRSTCGPWSAPGCWITRRPMARMTR